MRMLEPPPNSHESVLPEGESGGPRGALSKTATGSGSCETSDEARTACFFITNPASKVDENKDFIHPTNVRTAFAILRVPIFWQPGCRVDGLQRWIVEMIR